VNVLFGVAAHSHAVLPRSYRLPVTQTYRRIVRVDLKFPVKPAVSEGAKDFIRAVSELRRLSLWRPGVLELCFSSGPCTSSGVPVECCHRV
jgi:hypothetical protein